MEVFLHSLKFGKLGTVLFAMLSDGTILSYITLGEGHTIARAINNIIRKFPIGSTISLSIPLARIKTHSNLITAAGQIVGNTFDPKTPPFNSTISSLKSLARVSDSIIDLFSLFRGNSSR